MQAAVMRSGGRRIAALLIGCLAALLTGCATPDPPVPAGISYQQALELGQSRYSYDLRILLRDYPDATLPGADRVQMVTAFSEWSAQQVGCLTEMGIDGARVTVDGYAVLGENDPEAEAVARFACRYRYMIDPRVRGALSAEQAGYAWDYLVKRVVPCMRSIGFETSEPPGRDEFIAYSQRVWGAARWSPYDRFQDPFFGPERALVDQFCPPLPDDPFAVFNGTLSERLRGEE